MDIPAQFQASRADASRAALTLARCIGLFAAAAGAAVLTGWHLNDATLKQVLPDLVSMKANSAIGLTIAGLGLLALTVRVLTPVARLLGLALVALGAVSASQDYLGIDLGIDQWLFEDTPPSRFTLLPGRMSPAAAGTYIALGLALLFTKRQGWLSNLLADVLVAGVFINALLVLIGYGYGVTALYYPFPFTAVALHGAVSFLLLAVGMFAASPERGIAAAMVDRGPGGQMARLILPGVIAVPILLGWLRHRGEVAGLYDTAVGTALFAVSSIILLVVFTWFTAGLVRRADRERQAVLGALRGQREWLSTTLASIGDAVIATDDKGAVMIMNRVAEQLSGWDLASAAGLPIWEVFKVVDESTRHPVEDPALRALKERAIVQNADHLLLTRDGREIAIEDNGAPIMTGDGEIAGAVLIFRDITERRRAEQRQTMLMNELDHRVKNVLTIVHSLVQASFRQAAGKGAEGMATALTERLQSLSRAHELLLETQWSGASLKAMVERELEPYRREGVKNIAVKGPDVLLPPQATSVLAMTLHELATNAVKYGALSHSGGRLKVEWKVRGGKLLLVWDETCARPVSTRQTDGFGMQLIERGIRHNLGGATRIEFRKTGLLAEIEMPMQQPAEPPPLAAASA